jgi:hypothetical protein
MWSEHHDQLEAEARSAHDMKNVLYAVGAVATVGGSVLYYLGWREGQARVTLVPIASSKGGSIHGYVEF